MRYIFLLTVFTSILVLAKEKVTIGLGSYFKTQPYKNVDRLDLLSPVIFYDNSIVYVRWSRVGLYFAGEKKDDYSWGFSLTAMPRTYGYGSKDLDGMKERKSSWEGGIAFGAKYKKYFLEILVLDDILNKHQTYTATMEVGSEFKYKKISFYPTIFVTYQSSKFLDYYYGVTKDEAANSNFQEYSPTAGYLVGMQSYIEYPLTNSLSTFINLRVDKIPSSAKSSPLVDSDYIYSGLLSLIYTFSY